MPKTDIINYIHSLVGKTSVHDIPIKFLENKTFLVPVEILKPHEQIIPSHLCEIIESITTYQSFNQPIIVDARTLTVLDGHHRLEAVKALGLNYIPALFVDYAKDYVRVTTWRNNFLVDKKTVILAAHKKEYLPPKTSRHLLCGIRVYSTNIPLRCLADPRKCKLLYLDCANYF